MKSVWWPVRCPKCGRTEHVALKLYEEGLKRRCERCNVLVEIVGAGMVRSSAGAA